MRLSRVRQPNKVVTAATAAMLGIALAATAQAAGSGMPWEEPLQQVLESVQGPVAKIIAVIIIMITSPPTTTKEKKRKTEYKTERQKAR